MATKTISLELDAYEKLRRAKRSERESFSSVVRRGHWEDAPATGPELLESLRRLKHSHPESFLADEALDAIDQRARSRSRRKRPE